MQDQLSAAVTPKIGNEPLTLDYAERKLIEALQQGILVEPHGKSWRGGGVAVSSHVVVRLHATGLVRYASGGVLRLTPLGEMWRVGMSLKGAARRLLVGRGLASPEELKLLSNVDRKRRACARSVTVNLAESPLGWLAARGMISERQLVAGERLRSDWTSAGLASRVTMRWDAMPRQQGGATALEPTATQLSARRRFDEALAMAGSGLSDILWRVVCAGEGISIAETALGWPKRSAKLVLGFALDRIAAYYRID